MAATAIPNAINERNELFFNKLFADSLYRVIAVLAWLGNAENYAHKAIKVIKAIRLR